MFPYHTSECTECLEEERKEEGRNRNRFVEETDMSIRRTFLDVINTYQQLLEGSYKALPRKPAVGACF
jgi:hypothetical protein